MWMYLFLFLALMVGIPLAMLVAVICATVYSIKAHPPVRSLLLKHLFTTAAFSLVDLIVLVSLPYLQISFGPIWVPLIAWWMARLVILIAWLVSTRSQHHIEQIKSLKQRMRPFSMVFYALNITLFAVMLYGFVYEPHNLRVTHLTFSTDRQLPQNTLRIAHISDIHVTRLTQREHDLIKKVAAIKPDLILLTGDYLNLSILDDPSAQQNARWMLSQLDAPLGVYAVNGTVEGSEEMETLFSGLEITVLENETARIKNSDLHLVGVTDSHYAMDDALSLAQTAGKLPPVAFTILLYHTPDLIEAAADIGIDLYLAGHTHGGQIRLPFYGALITFSAYGKQYEMGQYNVGSTTLYVTRGIGLEGSIAPRARFLCPPELVIIDLEMESSP